MHYRNLIMLLFLCFAGSCLRAQSSYSRWYPVQLDENLSFNLPTRPSKRLNNMFTADKTVATACNDQFYSASYSDIQKISPRVLPMVDSLVNLGYRLEAATDTVRRLLYDDYVYQDCTVMGYKAIQRYFKVDSVQSRGYMFFSRTDDDEIMGTARILVYSNKRLYIFENRFFSYDTNSTRWLKMISSISIANKD